MVPHKLYSCWLTTHSWYESTATKKHVNHNHTCSDAHVQTFFTLWKNMSATSRNIIVAGCLHPFSKKTPGTFPKTTRRMQIWVGKSDFTSKHALKQCLVLFLPFFSYLSISPNRNTHLLVVPKPENSAPVPGSPAWQTDLGQNLEMASHASSSVQCIHHQIIWCLWKFLQCFDPKKNPKVYPAW